MAAACCAPVSPTADPRYRRILWIALVINAAMFVVEIFGSTLAASVSLLADSIDFFGDAGNYALSLAALSWTMQARARASLFKAACMGLFGVAVLARAAWSLSEHGVPAATEMGLVAVVALAANLGVALLLYRYRSGDSNMRSVWICSRNDAIGNIAVMMAALGVFGTGSAWPDLAVAVLMAGLGLWGALTVFKAARGELTMSAAPAEVPDCCAATQEVRVPFVIKRQHGPQ